jgi:hypothetical protein
MVYTMVYTIVYTIVATRLHYDLTLYSCDQFTKCSRTYAEPCTGLLGQSDWRVKKTQRDGESRETWPHDYE